MTYVTNFFLALPSIGFIILAFLFVAGVLLALYKSRNETVDVSDIKNIIVYFGLAVAVWMIAIALFSPIFLPKNSIDKLPNDTLQLKLDDELRSIGTETNRVPTPKKREVFVHDLGKEKQVNE